VCSPSPSPTPLPILAIISEFPDNYTGPTANLTAISNNNDTCVEAPSARLNATNNVTVVSPGAGLCNNDGKMPPGNYSFTQTPPAGTVFVEWVCYEIMGTNQIFLTSGKTPVVDLSGTKQVTCKAKYELAPTRYDLNRAVLRWGCCCVKGACHTAVHVFFVLFGLAELCCIVKVTR
jgi:hypothetical protein